MLVKVRHVSKARGSSDGATSLTVDIGLEYLDLDSNTVSQRVSASQRWKPIDWLTVSIDHFFLWRLTDSSKWRIPYFLLSNLEVCYRPTTTRLFSLPWARSIRSTSTHSISLRTTLTLSYYRRLGLPNDLFPSGFPTWTLQAFLLFPLARVTCPAYLVFMFISSTIYKEECELWNSSLCSSIHSTVTSSILDPNMDESR